MMEYLLNFLLGLGIGLIAGLFGVGGGFLIVPTLTFTGVPMNIAIGTSLACITISSLSSAAMHMREGRVLYRVALLTAAFSIPMAVLGSYASTMVDEKILRILFAILLLYLAYSFTKHKDRRNPEDEEPAADIKYSRVPFIGAFSGVASGLLGVSGGIINVPFFHNLARIPLKYAVGTSSFALFFTSLAAAYTHYTLGQVDIIITLTVTPGLIIGSLIGAYLVSKVPSEKLKIGFAGLLVIIALKMLL